MASRIHPGVEVLRAHAHEITGDIHDARDQVVVVQRYGDDCVLVGFSTYSGEVTAASNWGDPPQRKQVRPALEGSVEALLHRAGIDRFWIDTATSGMRELLSDPLLKRAIGVIYRPETERQSHYFPARVADQFDVMIHLDRTRAVEPLERSALWDAGEPPETYPTGL